MDSFERFIVENEGADTVRLVMSRREWPSPGDAGLAELDAKSLAVNTIEGRKKLRKKLPEWGGVLEAGLSFDAVHGAVQFF